MAVIEVFNRTNNAPTLRKKLKDVNYFSRSADVRVSAFSLVSNQLVCALESRRTENRLAIGTLSMLVEHFEPLSMTIG